MKVKRKQRHKKGYLGEMRLYATDQTSRHTKKHTLCATEIQIKQTT